MSQPQAMPSATPLWVPPGHFYSPIPDIEELRAWEQRLLAQSLRTLLGIDLGLERQREVLQALLLCYGEEDFAPLPRPERRYCLANDYFGYGDAFAYFAMLRRVKPKRVIEVGAGWSSAVLLDTDERFLGNSIECTFIEPFPERLLSLLRPSDLQRTRLLQSKLQDVPLEEFTRLERNDILFIDSSHVSKTGSDVNHAVFEILPRLASGVLVHFHDVFANFEYPAPWVLEGRAWNEAYLLRAFLMHNREWSIELHGATLVLAFQDEILAHMPRLAQCVGASLWLRKL